MFLRMFRRSPFFLSFRQQHQPVLKKSTFFCAAPYFLPILSRQLLTSQFLHNNAPPTTTTTTTTTAAAAAAVATDAADASLTTSPQPPQPPQPPFHETLSLLPALKSQHSHYITIHIHNFPFLVTLGDTIHLPFRIPETRVGDLLKLTNASVLGSRDYTLKGAPWIDERLFVCRARVVEETSEPLRIKEKTKRRQRRTKTVKSKHRYTVLRICELEVRDPGEGEVEGSLAAVGAVGEA